MGALPFLYTPKYTYDWKVVDMRANMVKYRAGYHTFIEYNAVPAVGPRACPRDKAELRVPMILPPAFLLYSDAQRAPVAKEQGVITTRPMNTSIQSTMYKYCPPLNPSGEKKNIMDIAACTAASGMPKTRAEGMTPILDVMCKTSFRIRDDKSKVTAKATKPTPTNDSEYPYTSLSTKPKTAMPTPPSCPNLNMSKAVAMKIGFLYVFESPSGFGSMKPSLCGMAGDDSVKKYTSPAERSATPAVDDVVANQPAREPTTDPNKVPIMKPESMETFR